MIAFHHDGRDHGGVLRFPQPPKFHLGPAALLAQQVSVAVRLLPLLLVRVSPHQFPVTQVVDLLPLLLAADTFLVLHPRLQTQIHTGRFESPNGTTFEPRRRPCCSGVE